MPSIERQAHQTNTDTDDDDDGDDDDNQCRSVVDDAPGFSRRR